MAATPKVQATTLSAAELGDEQAAIISDANKQQKQEGALEDADLRAIMQLPQGRRLMARILNLTQHRVDPFAAGFPDLTAKNIGRASVGKMLEDILTQTCFQEFLTMLRENTNRGEN